MTFDLKYDGTVESITLNFKGVKVQLDNRGEDLYEININDPENRFSDDNLLVGYSHLTINRIWYDECSDMWWCCGIYDIFGSGYICNGSVYKLEHINIILNAIENSLAELERLSQPEIIKIGNVTINKQNLCDGKVKISVDGLPESQEYPNPVYHGNSGVAFKLTNCDVFVLHYKNKTTLYVNDCAHLPIKDLIVSKEQYKDIIDIITESEAALEEYKKIKVGDKVEFKLGSDILYGIVLDVEDEYNTCIKTKYENDCLYVKKYLKDLKKV